MPDKYASITRIFVLAILLTSCSTIRQARLLEPTWFGLEQIGPRIYVEKEVPEDKRYELLGSYKNAGMRISGFYGKTLTDPIVIGCASRECIRSFGGFGDGYVVRKVTPGILLWTKVFGPGEVSHEWAHLELHARIGRTPMRRTVPIWFHEGLATVIGNIPRHSEAVYQEAVTSGYPIPPLGELRSEKQWGAAFGKYPNPKGLNVVYATAGHEVRTWLRRVGKQGLFELIDAVRNGEEFDAAYHRISSQNRTGDQPYALLSRFR